MLQGAHFPIAILAGCGLALLLMHPAVRRAIRSVNFAAAVLLIVLALTNFRFITREITNYQDNRVQSGQRAYLNPGELEALRWIEINTPARCGNTAVTLGRTYGRRKLSLLDITPACFAPGLTHRHVYCGHWGETPDYGDKLQKLIRFSRPDMPDEFRINMLTEMRVQYLMFSQKHYQSNPDYPSIPCSVKRSSPLSIWNWYTPMRMPTYTK